MTTVRLVDLDVFKRYSLAIRQETAPAEEVLDLLDATRRQVIAAAAAAAEAGAEAGADAGAAAAGPRGEAHPAAPGGMAEEDDVADSDWAPDAVAWAAEAQAGGPAGLGVGPAEQRSPEAGRPSRRRVRRTAEPPPAAGQ